MNIKEIRRRVDVEYANIPEDVRLERALNEIAYLRTLIVGFADELGTAAAAFTQDNEQEIQ